MRQKNIKQFSGEQWNEPKCLNRTNLLYLEKTKVIK